MMRIKNNRIIIAVITFCIVAAALPYYYAGQQRVLAQLHGALDAAAEHNSYLETELARLSEEVERRRAEDDRKNGARRPGGDGPTAYLTIDDGPSRNTLEILEILRFYRTPATFFVTGNNVSGDSGIYRRILAEGHALGNHTYTHNFAQIYGTAEAFMEDFLRLEDFLYRETGVRTRIMRFPGGSSSTLARKLSGYDIIAEELIPAVLDRGYDYFDWNIGSGDGDPSQPAAVLLANVKEQVERSGGGDIVVLLHDGRSNQATVEALPAIIEFLQSRNYRFAPLSWGAINVKHR